MSENPLDQFAIHKIYDLSLFGYDISISNSTISMLSAIMIIFLGFYFCFNNASEVPTRKQAFVEMIYDMIVEMIGSNIGPKGKQFLPLILTIFLFITLCNLLGMLPYSFTATSQLIVTFSIAIMIFIIITFYGFYLHGKRFLSIFLPKGTPAFLVPLMIIIELFSFLAKPISLSLRLCANMVAGHILLEVITAFVVIGSIFIKFVPVPFIIVLIGFEVFVSLLQAYIFAILSCVYLNDAVNLH